MTEKLYDTDAYLTHCTTTVISCKPAQEGTFSVVLKATVFFPEEGGQTPDKGQIDDCEVVDVQIKDGIITHTISCPAGTPPFQAGDEVHCTLDFKHRFSNMQQHTGEHIFSGFVYEEFGYDNVGFHLSDSIVTMDYNGSLSPEDVSRIEAKCNAAIFRGAPVFAEYPSEEVLSCLNYRSKKDLTGPIRIVTIEDIDVCACCAPHVKNISEVGLLKVIDYSGYKGGIRLSILCGKRAVSYFDNLLSICRGISQITSKPVLEIEEGVSKQKETINTLQLRLFELQKELLKKEAEALPINSEDVFLFTDISDMNIIRYQVNELTELHSGFCGIFSRRGDGYNFIIGSGTKDCNEAGRQLKERFNARCGGKPKMIQGFLTAQEADILSYLRK